ncbi:MAG: T9SS type A sorting domain-containing protein, partial [Muribaculaceae bacterium]|nr:T9SS type A sorting domain-containing protein [Muribaculaceae bacterium]
LDGVTYKVFGHNEATGSYNIILNNWNRSLQLPDYPIRGGQDYYFRATPSSLILLKSGVDEVSVDETRKIVLNGSTVECAEADSIRIYSLTGMLMHEANAAATSVDTLPKGVYIAVATGTTFSDTRRFVKR